MGQPWTATDIPDQSGKTVIVTGANRGLGRGIAGALASAGATVVMACRDPAKAEEAATRLRQHHPQARVETMALDLCDLASVRSFAAAFSTAYGRLDILCHNAGAILVPLSRTRDGFERHIGTNHLGPFALTGLLMDTLRAAPAARVVSMGSLAHRMTQGLDLDDLQLAQTPYKEMDAYARSKLATLSFSTELARRLQAHGLSVRSLAAHPGYTATNTDLGGFFMRLSTRLFAQPPAVGALPALYAATAGDAGNGDYFGPAGFKELRGYPKRVQMRPEARDPALGGRLWTLAEQLTGVRYLDA